MFYVCLAEPVFCTEKNPFWRCKVAKIEGAGSSAAEEQNRPQMVYVQDGARCLMTLMFAISARKEGGQLSARSRQRADQKPRKSKIMCFAWAFAVGV